jgi:hypothetical protein
VVVTGTVACASFVVAAAVSGFGWSWDDWDRLAGAAVAGAWLRHGAGLAYGHVPKADSRPWTDVGPPVVEIGPQGQVSLRGSSAAGGILSQESVAPWIALLAFDPAHWLTPDVDVNLMSIQLSERPDLQDLLLWGATGRPAPASYDTTLWYHDGYIARAEVLAHGMDQEYASQEFADIVRARVRASGHEVEHWEVHVARQYDKLPPASTPATTPLAMLRLTAADRSRAAVEQFAAEVAALAGTTLLGVTLLGGDRPVVEPRVRSWPTAVPRDLVGPIVETRSAKEWL